MPSAQSTRRSFPWLAATLVAAVLGALGLTLFASRPKDTTVIRGGYRFEAKFPEQMTGFTLATRSAVPDYLALVCYSEDMLSGWVAVVNIHTLETRSRLPTRPFIRSQHSYLVWPDGTQLFRTKEEKLADDTRRGEYYLQDAEDKRLAGPFVMGGFGTPLLRNGVVYRLAERSPATAGLEVIASMPQTAATVVAALPDSWGWGWTWDDGELTFAAITDSGRVMVFAGSPPQWAERPELAQLGQAALQTASPRRHFYLTESFAAWQTPGALLLIAADGSIERIATLDPNQQQPDGSPRGNLFYAIVDAESSLRGRGAAAYEDYATRTFVREGRRAPANVLAERSNRVALLSPSSIAVVDRQYRRVVVVSRDEAGGA